jgi:hypothetical protein
LLILGIVRCRQPPSLDFFTYFDILTFNMADKQLITKGDLAEARDIFESLAKRLDDLWRKPVLTKAEEREVQLILNNAMVIEEVTEGKEPNEFSSSRKVA